MLRTAHAGGLAGLYLVRSAIFAWPRAAVAESAVSEDDRVAALYARFGPAIYSRCRRILGDPAAAEDATQETFLRVVRYLERAPDGREALAWIYRIATNYCLNEVRNRRLRPELRETLPEAASPTGTERQLLDIDLARRLVAAAPEKLRVVAWLYHVDGFEQAELAALLGVSRRTVVTRLSDFDAHARRFAEAA